MHERRCFPFVLVLQTLDQIRDFPAQYAASTSPKKMRECALESANAAGFLCERMDAEVFVGDVLAQIKDRIDSCSLLIAILTGDNPNVYLEIGYAWGRQKPTILAVKDGHAVRFDVQGQRYLK